MRWTCLWGTDADAKRLVKQLSHLDANYNGGLRAYIQNAKRLLDDSREGVWPEP